MARLAGLCHQALLYLSFFSLFHLTTVSSRFTHIIANNITTLFLELNDIPLYVKIGIYVFGFLKDLFLFHVYDCLTAFMYLYHIIPGTEGDRRGHWIHLELALVVVS